MLITDFKVFITRCGDGSITFRKDRKSYRIFLNNNDKVIMEIFNKYYDQLNNFKQRHYAIATWIVRDIRDRGYYFKAYSNNNHNIRPLKPIENYSNRYKNLYKQQIMENLHRNRLRSKVSDFERLLH